ncbi:endoplasmic reticulum junction formation protein lunapark-B-like [Oppia nitens]|uniref:endoplasmic reticulum junction formation protein lunapark-B-like n=1 Tax=Oppia nitens TaxID=1686743 RepID=UPI0023DADF51|nr:endoplasmic reticulum junction formation protein lunapark-B-like [Oppia nitens]
MGSLLSIFRTKRATKAILEDIENEMESLQDLKESASKREKTAIFVFLVFIVMCYTIAAFILFRYYIVFNTSKENLIINSVALLVFIATIFGLYGLKRLLHWYYRWIQEYINERLKHLRRQKKKILEKVKETENFKDAKEILEKYDPNALFEGVSFRTLSNTPLLNQPTQSRLSIDPQLRYRGGGAMNTPIRPMPAIMSSTPQRPTMTGFSQNLIRGPQLTPQRMPMMAMPPPVRLIKPILPQRRSVMDKLVDYVVGDGPNNRYALICIHCYSHNGMALKDEFEYIQYKCGYCKQFNPPRKVRPIAPRIESQRTSLPPVIDEPESDTESERGRSNQQTTNIQEISTLNDVHNDNHNNKDSDKNRVRSDTSDESIDAQTVNSTTKTGSNETINCSEDVNQESENKHQLNSNNSEIDKEIPFIDEQNI